jgi:nucleotide-binding universal stress UspA family protein
MGSSWPPAYGAIDERYGATNDGRRLNMIRKILVGTDTSASADLAVAAAAELARSNDAELLVLYVKRLDDARDAVDPKKPPDTSRYLRALTHRFPGVRTTTREGEGDPAREICQVAKAERSDLIVVGNRGAAERRRFGREGVPNAVVRHSPCSVLVVDTRLAQ